MNFLKMWLTAGFILFSSLSLFADIPIHTGSNLDSDCAIAYNPTKDEYMVVWNKSGKNVISAVYAQRLDKSGTPIGNPVMINQNSSNPDVAYNAKTNEYLVVFETIIVFTGQVIYGIRLDAAGSLITGSGNILMEQAGSPKIIYNTLDDSYLLGGALLYDSGSPDLCNIKIYTRKISSTGKPVGTTQLIRDEGNGLCTDGARYSIAYAPVTSTETPQGRFLLVINGATGFGLTMLDDNGDIVSKVFDSQSGTVVDNHVPFQTSKVGIAYNASVAYGNWQGDPAFMVVWGDRDKQVDNQEWTGIWAGIVSATQIEFDAHAGVSNTVFPVSRIWYHNATSDYAKSWKPVVAYNQIADKFMVAWRETPSTDPNNDTKVNHIRANAVNSPDIPIPKNIVLSAVTGNEDPRNPAIAASTKNVSALVAWQDARNSATSDIDIYGSLYKTTPAHSLKLTVPNGGENWQAGSSHDIKWTNQNFNDPVKIEYSVNNGNSYSTISSSTSNTGTYSWQVPSTTSKTCLVRISDAADGNPTDISDAAFIISAPQNTPTGKKVNVDLGNGTDVTFDDVTGAGNTTLNITQTGSPPPNGFLIFPSGTPQYYNIKSTAKYTDNIEICIKYDASLLTPAEESKLRLYVYEMSPGKWKNITASMDVTENIICGTVSHLSEFAMMLGPVHFNFAFNTGESYSLIINNATLDGNTLDNGDEIGVLTQAGLCVGASVWNGTSPLALTAWGDDSQTNEVDGYKIGEKMSFRIWDSSSGSEDDYPATPNYSKGNGNFGDGAFAQISLLKAARSTIQILSIEQGWSWISLNVEPADLAIDRVMAGVNSLEIVINGDGQFYIPNVVNSIGQMNVLEGYKIYVNAPAQISDTGKPVNAATPIPLKAGWNFISYLPASAMPVETALAPVLSQLAIVKDDEGKFLIPNVINSLGNMTPGEGYKLYLNAVDTLTYPQGAAPAKQAMLTIVTNIMRPSHFKFPNRTGGSYSVVINSLQVHNQQPETGDEVGIFTADGLCVGAGVWDGSGVIPIAAWADDKHTVALDGYRTGEKMYFRFWQKKTGQEIELSARFTKGNGKFGDGAFTTVELQGDEIPAAFSLEQNYPNPFNAGTMISYQLPEAGKVVLKVYNILGKEVSTLVDGEKEAGSYRVHWDGKDSFRSMAPSGVYIYRIKAGSFSATKKAVFMK